MSSEKKERGLEIAGVALGTVALAGLGYLFVTENPNMFDLSFYKNAWDMVRTLGMVAAVTTAVKTIQPWANMFKK